MDELTHLTNYFTESSRVLRMHGTREKVVTKCVKSVKFVKSAIFFLPEVVGEDAGSTLDLGGTGTGLVIFRRAR